MGLTSRRWITIAGTLAGRRRGAPSAIAPVAAASTAGVRIGAKAEAQRLHPAEGDGGVCRGCVRGQSPRLTGMMARPRVPSPFRRRDPRTWRRTAKRLGPPLFALRGAGAPHRGGFGWGSDGTYHASVLQTGTQGEVTVETGSGHPFFDEWMLLHRWLHEAVDRGHPPTFPVELRADRWVAAVTFSGAPYEFTFVGGQESWAAQGVVAGRQVRLQGRGPTDDLVLEAVAWRAVRGRS
jgi:hypothetical protein